MLLIIIIGDATVNGSVGCELAFLLAVNHHSVKSRRRHLYCFYLWINTIFLITIFSGSSRLLLL